MSSKDEQKGAIQVAPQNALSADLMAELQKDAGAGLENVRAEDLVMPFLMILQKMSPLADAESGIPGAKVGQLLETATQTLYDKVQLIPCAYRTCIVEWHPLATGGGFVAQHEMGYQDKFRREGGKWITDEGNELVQTMYFCCLLQQASGDWMPVVMSFTSSQLKKARTWVSRLSTKTIDDGKGNKFKAPIYESIWEGSTVTEQNEKGSWKGYQITPLKPLNDLGLVKQARAARAMFETNRAIAQPAAVTPEEN